MELLKLVLPNEVVSKVRLYHSHPVADLLHPWIFKFEWGNAEENSLPEFDYTRKQFHLVILDTLSREREKENEKDHVRMWEYIRQLEAQGHVLTDRDIKFIGYRFNQ